MNEMSKSHASRLRNSEYPLLKGDVLDVGCGPDPIKLPDARVRGWDMEDGDAQYLSGIENNSFDAVVSAHCLEHMVNVPTAVRNWARVLKPSGHMLIYVPSWMFYERMQWPSRYNPDHKAIFDLVDPVKLPGNVPFYSMKMMEEIGTDCGLKLFSARLELDNYDLSKIWDLNLDQTMGNALAQISFLFRKQA